MYAVRHGDVLDVLPTIPDGSVDAVLCDPPYGLSDHRHADVVACLTAWLSGEAFRPKGKGFAGRGWDAWVPGPECWREVLRVLRPGGHALVFAGTRSMDLMAMALRLAGFEIRECIRSLNGSDHYPGWVYGGGLAKHGARIRPGWEPVIVARKPVVGTIAANIAVHGTGGLNIDGCRIDRGGDKGQHPINVIHDGSPEVMAEFAALPDTSRPGKRTKGDDDYAAGNSRHVYDGGWKEHSRNAIERHYDDAGTAARFFKECRFDDEETTDLSLLLWQYSSVKISVNIDGGGKCRHASSAEKRLGSGRGGRTASVQKNAADSIRQESGVSSHQYGRNARSAGYFSKPSLRQTRFIVRRTALLSEANCPGHPASDAVSLSRSCVTSIALDLARAGTNFVPDLRAVLTSVTPSEFGAIKGALTTAIQIIGRRFLPASQRVRLSLEIGPVRCVAALKLTGITTITISHWKSDGSAAPVTFDFMPMSGAHGEAGSPRVKRFMYAAKASGHDRWLYCKICGTAHPKREIGAHQHGRDDVDHIVMHPTVKPVSLVEYLARLVMPTVMDRSRRILVPFAGSGSEMVGALRAGWEEVIGIEMDADYAAIAKARCADAVAKPAQLDLIAAE